MSPDPSSVGDFYRYSPFQPFYEACGQRSIKLYLIFLFMSACALIDPVYELTHVSEQYQALRVLVKPSYRVDPAFIRNKVYDIGSPVLIGACAYHSPRLIAGKEHGLFPFTSIYLFSVKEDPVSRKYPVSGQGCSSIDPDPALGYQPVSLTP